MNRMAPTGSDDYQVTSRRFKHAEEIQRAWVELEKRSSCSFFQSWGWIGNWLESVVPDLDRFLVEISDDQRVIAMGILVSHRSKRRVFIRSFGLFLNEFPVEDMNMAVEYNGLLIDADVDDASQVYRALFNYLLCGSEEYDELYAGGIDQQVMGAIMHLRGDRRLQLISREKSISWQVDLNQFGSDLEAYLGTLSRNRRTQIRRSIRLYEAMGALQLEEAQNTDEALGYFNGLERLHSARWQRKGLQGSFVNPVWIGFHRALIANRYPQGEVQLLRARAGSEVIGYLYNFIWRNRVYILQTGFAISDDRRLMPGYIVHAMAIVHNRRKGMDIYDFMHGDSIYKRVLSNRSETLYWVSMQRRRLKFLLENRLLALYRCGKKFLKGASGNAL